MLENENLIREAANATGFPLAGAMALIEMESGGRNVFGSDTGGMFKGQGVTQAKFEMMERNVAAGGRSNGVGPTQITWKGFFPDARRRGLKLWEPYDNMLYGFDLANGYWKKYGNWVTVGTRYNGGADYGRRFAVKVKEWETRLGVSPGREERVMVAKAGNGWKLAPSLIRLMDEVDAKWPKRSTRSDGSIGDTSHAARYSEHNPDRDSDGMPTGFVSAVDITKDSTAQMDTIRKALVGDSRTWYVIHNRKIYSRTYGFKARPYNGPNPHTAHLHVSLMQTKAAANGVGSWGLGEPAPGRPPAVKPPPTASRFGSRTLKHGSDGDDVALLQRFLGVRPDDGVFGPVTEAAVRKYQQMRGLEVDGIAGPLTLAPIMRAVGL